MKKENNTGLSKQNEFTPKDEGEHFEIDILRLIKVKSRRVSGKVIIAILLILVFVWLMVKG